MREWVGTVVADALRFAVRYDGGGAVPRARDNWQPEEGSAAYVVESLVMELKRTVLVRPKPARPGQLPPRVWHEHVYNIAKVSGPFILVWWSSSQVLVLCCDRHEHVNHIAKVIGPLA